MHHTSMTILKGKGLLILFLTLIILAFNSCEKKQEDLKEKDIINLSNDEDFLNWTNTKRSEWLAYLLPYGDEASKLSTKEKLNILVLNLKQLKVARDIFKNRLAIKLNADTGEIDKILVQYLNQNKNVVDSIVANKMSFKKNWLVYKELHINSALSSRAKTMSLNKTSDIELWEVEITACFTGNVKYLVRDLNLNFDSSSPCNYFIGLINDFFAKMVETDHSMSCDQLESSIYDYINQYHMCVFNNNHPDQPGDPGDGGGGTGGTGGSGGTNTPAAPGISFGNNSIRTPYFEIIADTISGRPCLSNILIGVVNSAEYISNVNDFFYMNDDRAITGVMALKNMDLTITVNSAAFPPDQISQGADGSTIVRRTNASTSATTGDITFNNAMLNDATDLAVAATLIHELMHSYFVIAMQKLQGTHALVWQEYHYFLYEDIRTGGNTPELSHHTQMAFSYVSTMADILSVYARSRGITTSPDASIGLKTYCEDLFWYSLGNTQTSVLCPDQERANRNGKREYKNQSNSSKKKGC